MHSGPGRLQRRYTPRPFSQGSQPELGLRPRHNPENSSGAALRETRTSHFSPVHSSNPYGGTRLPPLASRRIFKAPSFPDSRNKGRTTLPDFLSCSFFALVALFVRFSLCFCFNRFLSRLAVLLLSVRSVT